MTTLIQYDATSRYPAADLYVKAVDMGGVWINVHEQVRIRLPFLFMTEGAVSLLDMALDEIAIRLSDQAWEPELTEDEWTRLEKQVLSCLRAGLELPEKATVQVDEDDGIEVRMPLKLWQLMKRPDGFTLLAGFIREEAPWFCKRDWRSDKASHDYMALANDAVQDWFRDNESDLLGALRSDVMMEIDMMEVFSKERWQELTLQAEQAANRALLRMAYGR